MTPQTGSSDSAVARGFSLILEEYSCAGTAGPRAGRRQRRWAGERGTFCCDSGMLRRLVVGRGRTARESAIELCVMLNLDLQRAGR